MYFLTTFEELSYDEYGWDFGTTRTIGYFKILEDAQRRVINNECDICETIYDYAIIEKIESDRLYPEVIFQELYKVKDITKIENGKEVYNIDGLRYEKIDLPENFIHHSIVIA